MDWTSGNTLTLIALVVGIAGNIAHSSRAWGNAEQKIAELDKKVSNGLSSNVNEIYGKVNSIVERLVRVETKLDERRDLRRYSDKEVGHEHTADH